MLKKQGAFFWVIQYIYTYKHTKRTIKEYNSLHLIATYKEYIRSAVEVKSF